MTDVKLQRHTKSERIVARAADVAGIGTRRRSLVFGNLHIPYTCSLCLNLEVKAIKPLLAAAQYTHRRRRPHNPTLLDTHYQTIYAGMQGIFHELGVAA